MVEDRRRLVAAVELKSQAGPSFGNNFNNRVEEALGSATDVWEAYRKGSFGDVRPWLGYVFVLENATKSTTSVEIAKSVFATDPVLEGASYLDRYRVLCKRLLQERLYDAVCFVAASKEPGSPIIEPDDELSFTAFRAAIRARITFIVELGGFGSTQ